MIKKESMLTTKIVPLSTLQLFYLALGGFGVQFSISCVMNNASGLFKLLGVMDTMISLLWLIAPLSGLFIQPVMGQFSDLVNTRYGKRSPFIFVGMLLSVSSLIILVFLEWIWCYVLAILLLNCSINCINEALRSLIGDLTAKEQRITAFAWQTALGGVGAMFASMAPWLLESIGIFVAPDASHLKIPIVMKITFLLSAIILFKTIMRMLRNVQEPVEPSSINTDEGDFIYLSRSFKFIRLILSELLNNLTNVPRVIKKYFLVQCFVWAGMFCVWLYLGIAIAQHIYGLPVTANVEENLAYKQLLHEGMVTAGILIAIYQATSIPCVIILPMLTRKFSADKIHASSLLVGSFSLLVIVITNNLIYIYIAMVGMGVMWGSLCTLPYVSITSGLPSGKMGTYLGIFNMTVTIPQIICGMSIGFINKYVFFNHAINTIGLASLMLAIAGIILIDQETSLIKTYFIWANKIIKHMAFIVRKNKL